MIKYNFKGVLLKGLLLTLLLSSICLTSLAANNKVTLSSVNIEGENSTFKIILKTSQDTQVLTKVPSKDQLIVELTDTSASNLIKTSFKNASQIDDIIVQPTSDNKIRIFISGKNVASSKIIVDSSKEEVITDRFTQVAETPANVSNVAQSNQANKADILSLQNNTNQTIATSEPLQTQNIPAPTVETITAQNAETTGVASGIQTENQANINNQNTTATTSAFENDVNSDLFKPEADVEAGGVAAKQAKQSTNKEAVSDSLQNSSIFSTPWLIKFGIIFVFITLLIAYLRKEKLLTFNFKNKKQKLSKEHLDIYRSLHTSNVSNINNRMLTTSAKATLSTLSKQNYAKPTKQNKALTNYNAIAGYSKTQKSSINKPITTSNKSTVASKNKAAVNTSAKINNSYNTNKLGSANNNNMAFLKSMADLYEKTGRHDLAVNIQKNIRKSTVS